MTTFDEKNDIIQKQLLDTQRNHFQFIQTTFQCQQGIIDCSPKGSGKTVTSILTAYLHGLDLVICGPKTLKGHWIASLKMFTDKNLPNFNVKIIHYFTMNAIRGSEGKQPNHPYLFREDEREDESPIILSAFNPIMKRKKQSNPKFTHTKVFDELLERKILLIIDESHSIKNKSAQNAAASAFLRAINRQKHSFFMLLSATIYDNIRNAINLFRALGFLSYDPIQFQYNKTIRSYFVVESLDFLLATSRQIDEKRTEHLIQKYPLYNKSKLDQFLHQLFVHVFKQRWISQMSPPILQYKKIWTNSYYTVDPKEWNNVLMVLEELETMAELILESRQRRLRGEVKDEDDEDDEPTEKLSIFPLLHKCEQVKIPMLVRVVRNQLSTDPNSKSIIFTNYKDTAETILELLHDFHPLTIQGHTKDIDRILAINSFQQNNLTTRVLVLNINCGSLGLNLCDIHGGQIRHLYILPSFKFIDMDQASGRADRIGMKTDSIVSNVYCNMPLDEAKILDNLRNKTRTLKSIVGSRNEMIGDISDYFESGKRETFKLKTNI